ncbi:MAG: cyclic nucleotide-binding domain-containing protein [Desulfobacteraceae bacterium]|nr:cyclic nucleotide-binding domain-containing protein [Desulfobacteraceae bacterium]
MVKIEDLKRINLLKDVPEHLLDIIAREAQLSIFSAGTQLITVNEKVENFYMLIMGQVAIKRNVTPDIDVILEYIQSGNSFGTSAIIKGSTAFYSAVCQEPSEIITVSGERMIQLFEKNHELAYHIMMDVSKRYKRFMDNRAQMIQKTIVEDLDMKDDIYDTWINNIK